MEHYLQVGLVREQAKRCRVELVRAINGGRGERGVRLEVEGGPDRRTPPVSNVERGELVVGRPVAWKWAVACEEKMGGPWDGAGRPEKKATREGERF